MYVVFDDFAEDEGAWVDDSDEWQWVPIPRGGLPPALPVAGAWRPGFYAPPLEKIYLSRPGPQGSYPPGVNTTQMYVKWKGMAHIHCQWVPQIELEVEHDAVGPNNKRAVVRFRKAEALIMNGQGGEAATWELEGGDNDERRARTEDEPFNPDFEAVERVIAVMTQEEDDLPPKYLVKWRGLPYASATWESCRTLLTEQTAIRKYWSFEQLPPPAERKLTQQKTRPPKTNFTPHKVSPEYKGGHTIRSYQVEGLNWLLFSWYNRRSVMLADEMGLGKTVQSVTTLHHIWKVENIRGPFLVLAPLSTLSHWLREFEGWTDFNVIVYHGSNESRELIRETEFYFTDESAMGMCKFHVLITRMR